MGTDTLPFSLIPYCILEGEGLTYLQIAILHKCKVLWSINGERVIQKYWPDLRNVIQEVPWALGGTDIYRGDMIQNKVWEPQK